MTSTQATQIPIGTIIPILVAIRDRDYQHFQELEKAFADRYGFETWEEVFNYRIKPALDRESDKWLLLQWCDRGIISVMGLTSSNVCNLNLGTLKFL